jgi:glyoxylase-like metal-dependent hydrolase (beta-lactamase superfamily II)
MSIVISPRSFAMVASSSRRSLPSHIPAHLAAVVLLLLSIACTDKDLPAPADGGDCRPTEHAPLPTGARGVPIDPQKGYALKEVRGGLYWVTNGSDQAAFLVATTGVIVIDAPPGLAVALNAAIRSVTDLPVTHLVYSHYHADHIGGASAISTTATVVAHSATKTALLAAADPKRPIPTVTFEDAYTLTVGNQTLQLSYAGPNHVAGNIFIYAPAQRTLILIDIVWPGWSPFLALGEAVNITGYRAALDRAMTFEFDTFIGGHVGRYGTKADVQQTKAFVDDLATEAGAALAAVSIQDVGAEVGFENPYVLVEEWFHRMAKRCADPLISRWSTVLGGADVFARSHCLAMIQHLRID